MKKVSFGSVLTKPAVFRSVIVMLLALTLTLVAVGLPGIVRAAGDGAFSTIVSDDFYGDSYNVGVDYQWSESLSEGSTAAIGDGAYKFNISSNAGSSTVILSAPSDDWEDYTVSADLYKKYLNGADDQVSYHPGILLLCRVQYDAVHGGYSYYYAKAHSTAGVVFGKTYYDENTGKFVNQAIGKSGGSNLVAADDATVNMQIICEGNKFVAIMTGTVDENTVTATYTYEDDGITYGPVLETGSVGMLFESMGSEERSWTGQVDNVEVVAKDDTVLFADDFLDSRYCDGVTYKWTDACQYQDGVYKVSTTARKVNLMGIKTPSADYGVTMHDYTTSADVRLEKAGTMAGIVAHHNGQKYYELRLTTSNLELYMVDGTGETLLKSVAVNVDLNAWHFLQMQVDDNGQTVRAYLDYQLKFELSNISNACTAGTMGLAVNGDASFDNLYMRATAESDYRPFADYWFKACDVNELATKWAVAGDWIVDDNHLVYSGSGTSVMPLKDVAALDDYQVTVVGSLAENGQLGLVGRYSAAGYYKLVLDQATGELVLSRVAGSTAVVVGKLSREQLYMQDVYIYAGENYELKLYMYGNALHAYIDGTRVLSCKDAEIQSGVAGVLGSSGASFKEMIVEEAVAAPTLTFVDRNGAAVGGTSDSPLQIPLGKLPDVTELYLLVDDGVNDPFTVPVDTLKFSGMVKDEEGVHALEVEYEGETAVLYYQSAPRTSVINTLISDIQTYAEKSNTLLVWLYKSEVNDMWDTYNDLSYIEKEQVSEDLVTELKRMREVILTNVYGEGTLGNVIFFDGFDTAASEDLYTNDYTKVSEIDPGNWFVLNGQMYQYDTHEIPMEFQGFSAANMVEGKNYRITSISVDMMLLDYYGGAGLRWACHNSDSYRVIISRRYNNTSRMSLEKSGLQLANHNDIISTLKPNFNVAIYTWYNLRVNFNHDTGLIQLYFDDKLIYEEYDTDMLNRPILHEGMVGLVGYGGWVIYDNLEIRGEEVEMPTDDWVQVDTNLEPKEYQDDFNDEVAGEDPSHWLENSAADLWKTKLDGTDMIYGSAGCTDIESSTWLHVFETNVDYSAKLRMTAQGEYARFGLTARVTGDTSYIKAGYDCYMGKWFIDVRYGYDFERQVYYADSAFDIQENTWYDIRLKAVEEQLELYVDGELMLAADAGKKVSVGRVGVFNDRCDVDVDDVDLQQLSGQGTVQDGVMEQYTAQAGTTIGTLFQVVELGEGQLLLIEGNNRYVSFDNGNTWEKDANKIIGKLPGGSTQSVCELHDGRLLYVLNWREAYIYDRQTRTSTLVGTINHPANTLYSQPAEHLSEVQLADGTWRIFLAMTEQNQEDLEDPIKDRKSSSHVFYSDDGGVTWTQSETDSATLMNLKYFGEPHVVKLTKDVVDLTGKTLPAGTLLQYSTHNSYNTMRYVVSYDGGVTWEGDYAIPYLTTAGMSSFTIEEDPYNPGTYYMAYPYNYPVRTGNGFPRLRVALMKSTDGYNWEYLCDVDRWGDVSDTDTGNTMQQVNMYLAVHKDHIFVSFSRSEQYAETTHRVQLGRLYRFEKDKLSVQEWPKEYIIPDKAIVAIEGISQDIPYLTDFEGTDALEYPIDGQLKVYYYDGTVGYVSMEDVLVSNLNTAVIGEQEIIADYMYFRSVYTVNVKVEPTVVEDETVPTLMLQGGVEMHYAFDASMSGKLLSISGEGAYVIVDGLRYDDSGSGVNVVLPESEEAIPVIIGNSSDVEESISVSITDNTGGYVNSGGVEYLNQLYFTLNSDGESYSVTGCYKYAGRKVIIPSTYRGKPVTAVAGSAFADCTTITSVVIPDTVTSIGASAFSSCTRLSAVSFCGTAEKKDTLVIGEGNEYLTGAKWIYHDWQGTVCVGCGAEAVSITQQPTSAKVAQGTAAEVTVAANGDSLTYVWYVKNVGDSAFAVAGDFVSNYYRINSMSADYSGIQVYCVITDEYGNSITSDTATLIMRTPLEIVQQPTTVKVSEGDMVELTIAVNGDGLTYKWYYKDAGESKYVVAADFTGASYSVEMTSATNGRQIFCIITDEYGNRVTTTTVQAVMRTPLVITQQPASVKVAQGTLTEVTVVVNGDGLSYKWYYKNAGESKYTVAADFTGASYSVEMTSAVNGRQVFCIITDEYGNRTTSDTVTLTMRTPLVITQQPVSVKVAQNTVAEVTVAVNGDGLTYKWYYKDAGDSAFSLSADCTGNSYRIDSMVAQRSGCQVYCVITDEYGNVVTTDTATLTMRTPLEITRQPVSVAVKENETAEATVAVTGDSLSYVWYVMNTDSTEWIKSSVTADTYSVQMTSAVSGCQVYCEITDEYGNTVISDIVVLTMQTPLEITQQPVSVKVAQGTVAEVIVAANGDSLTYQWYYKNTGDSAFSLSADCTGNSYRIDSMVAQRSGCQVYCVITDMHGNSITSDVVTLTMRTPLEIVYQPTGQVVVADGEVADITINVTGDGLTYKWYYKNAGESKYVVAADFTGASYSAQMTRAGSGLQVFCIIVDEYGGRVVTSTVTIVVQTPLEITQQPASVKVTEGTLAEVTVTAKGDELAYEWYYKDAGENEFTLDTSITGATYSVEMTNAVNGRQVYCVITDQYGNSVTTDTVTVSMNGALAITQQPASADVEAGTTVEFTVTAIGEGLTYQWQFYKPAYGKWYDSTTEGYNTNSITVVALDSRNGYQYRCVITDSNGNEVVTDAAALSVQSVEGAINIVKQPVSIVVNEGAAVKITVTATGEGLTYKWYYKNANSNMYYLSGNCTSNYYQIDYMDDARNGRQVYCVITDKDGNSVTSNVAKITLNDALRITQQPASVEVAAGDAVKVTVAVSGSENLTYKWYYKNAGSNMFYLSTTSTGDTYELDAMNATRDGRQIYCVITDDLGNSVTTKVATLTMNVSLQITQQPVSVAVGAGSVAKVTVTVEGGEGLTYKWYYKNADSKMFYLSGSCTGNSYQVDSMDAARDGRQVYCVITDKYGNSVTTKTVTLSMSSAIVIEQQPVSVTVAAGEVAKVTVIADGEGLTYKWYYKNAGAKMFYLSGNCTGNTYQVDSMDAARNGRQVYCEITDQNGDTIKTNTVTLNMA